MDGRRRSFIRLRPAHDTVRSGDETFDRNRLYFQGQMGVSRIISFISTDGWLGEEVDFTNNRLGRGANINFNAQIRPTNHLALSLTTSLRWLNISGDRLFTSQVERLRATYTFNPRMFLRAIVQNTRTNRDVDLYGVDVGASQHSGELSNQLLFAYKLNWQTVFYVGYGDLQEATAEQGEFEPSNRQFFAKLSYAFQR
jgi:hypothetical protein